jgi:hypothetical protein
MPAPLVEAEQMRKASNKELAEILLRWAPYVRSTQAKHAMLESGARLEKQDGR